MNTLAVNQDVKATRSEQPARPRKAAVSELLSWDEVNQKLAGLGELERQMRALRDHFEEKVAVLKQQLLEGSQPMAGEKKKFVQQIERFYWAHRGEVLSQGRKSVELAFGRLGSRSTRSVVVENAAAAQQWLAGNGLTKYLRTRTELDRESLRSALLAADAAGEPSPLLLRCPGVRLRESEEFWYEVDGGACDAIEGHSERESAGLL